MITAASPTEIAALWHLNLLSGDDVSAICMLWLERDVDRGDPEIAALAGEKSLIRSEVAPDFERILQTVIGRSIGDDEAILRALRLHLDTALKDEDLLLSIQTTIGRFASLSGQRLVHNPRRAADQPDEVYAEENLGLEYVYGIFHALDDAQYLRVDERLSSPQDLMADLRRSVTELRDHLAIVLKD